MPFEWRAAIAAVTYLLIVGMASRFAYRRLGIREWPVHGAIVVLPLVVYLIFADRIAGIKGFGVEATFREVARTSIVGAVKVVPTKSKVATDRPFEHCLYLPEGCPYLVVTKEQIDASSKDPSSKEALAAQLAEVIVADLRTARFWTLIITDKFGTPLRYFGRSWFIELPALYDVRINDKARATERGEPTPPLTILDSTALMEILFDADHTWPAGDSITLPADATYARAAVALSKTNGAEAIVVVDGDNHVAGIVTQRDVAAKLVGPLLGLSKE